MTDNAFSDVEPRSIPTHKGRPVTPRHAATLLIVDSSGARPKVLMGRRHGGHDFMPDKWVFPGGRIDKTDFTAPYATDYRPEVAERLHKTAIPSRARALGLAAIRETFEEAGLLMAKAAPVRTGNGPWDAFLAHGALPDLEALTFIARAVTPAASPKRFDARFFMADARRLLSMERLTDCGELDEIAWFEFEEALKLDLPSVTRFVINELPRHIDDPSRPAPSLRFIRSRQRIEML